MQETQTINNGLNAEIAAELDDGAAAVLKRVALWGTLLLLAFLLGFIPLWLSNRETTRQRDAAQANLRLSQLQNRLATAALSARRGEYEASRVAASDFFTDLRAEVASADESAFSAGQIEAVRPILADRDDLITLLARDDQAAAERLTDLYLNYAQAINHRTPDPQ